MKLFAPLSCSVPSLKSKPFRWASVLSKYRSCAHPQTAPPDGCACLEFDRKRTGSKETISYAREDPSIHVGLTSSWSYLRLLLGRSGYQMAVVRLRVATSADAPPEMVNCGIIRSRKSFLEYMRILIIVRNICGYIIILRVTQVTQVTVRKR